MSDSSDNNLGGGEDSDSDQDLFDDSRRHQNRQRARDEAIYGVFYDDDNHDSYDRRGGGGVRRSRRDDVGGGINIAPQFVKGKAKKDANEEEEKENEDEDDDDDMFRSKNDNDKEIGFQKAEEKEEEEEEEEEETEEEKAQAEEERQKQEAANDYFLSLLKRGKGEKDRRKPTSSSSQYFRSDTSTSAGTMGLGFRTGGGLGFTGESTQQSSKDTDEASAPSFAPATAGLGMQTAAQGLGMPSAFGAGNAFQKESKPAFVKDPNLGAWEKHTKGFGLKMLAKMGYKGSGGLGSTRRKKTVTDEKTGEKVEVEAPAKKGISRPVEVVVRPNNLGLGYGNFKEATKLKTNQQIEAEVRGIDLKKKQQEKEKGAKTKEASLQTSAQPRGESSALPSVQDLMQQKAWKRGAKQSQKSRKRPRRTVIPYTELLEQHSSSQPSVIIDMRGPATTAPDSSTDDKGQPKEVPLAEELLHNLSLLLNTYENRVHSNSHFVRSTQQKVQSFQSDISNMEQRREENRNRVQKLKTVLDTLDRIEAIVNKSASSNGNNSNDTSDIATVQSLVRELQESFTPDERAKLRFFDVLAPSLLEPVIQTRLEKWDPLKNDIKSNNETMEAVISFCKDYPTVDARDSESAFVMARTIFTNLLLPRVKMTLESQRWDPIHDVEIGLQLYEGLCRVADAASPPPPSKAIQPRDDNDQILPTEHYDDASEQAQQLKNLVKEEIIHKTVYFKLTRALSQWKPTLDESGEGLMDRPSLWILPWLPHLDHRSILPTLISDCKRKLKSAVSYLQKCVVADDAFCRATLQTVRPWCKVYPKETLQTLASTSIMLRIASAVATASSSAFHQKGGTNGSSGCPAIEWDVVEGAMEMHSSSLLADKEFLSIIEGELLSRWASRMHGWLSQDASHWKEAAEVYLEWRQHLFEGRQDSTTTTTSATTPIHLLPSHQCVKQDRMICAIFYSVLLMIQAANQSDKSLLGDLKPSATNARAVLARRTREEREKAQEELYRMEATGVASGTTGNLQDPASVEARVRAAQRHQGHTPTFREVVEEFASDNDVLFQPRMGNNSTKDGKQIFLFGEIPVYLESDVVFAYQSSEWKPTSLSQLGLMQKARN